MQVLNEHDIQERLEAQSEWAETGGAIQRTYLCGGFVRSIRFVNAVAEAAEADQHHPDILIRYDKVTLTLSTHDAGGVTEKDFAAASKADGFYAAL